jgi:hypothetical protein
LFQCKTRSCSAATKKSKCTRSCVNPLGCDCSTCPYKLTQGAFNCRQQQGLCKRGCNSLGGCDCYQVHTGTKNNGCKRGCNTVKGCDCYQQHTGTRNDGCKSGCNSVGGCSCTCKKGFLGVTTCSNCKYKFGHCYEYNTYWEVCPTKFGHCYEHKKINTYRKVCPTKTGHCYEHYTNKVCDKCGHTQCNSNGGWCTPKCKKMGHCYSTASYYACEGARTGSELVGSQCCSWIS